MFINVPENPSNLKKVVYLIASTILGILLAFIVFGLFEINYLNWAISSGRASSLNDVYALLNCLQGVFVLLSAIGGFFLGRFWWRKVYVERIWSKRS